MDRRTLFGLFALFLFVAPSLLASGLVVKKTSVRVPDALVKSGKVDFCSLCVSMMGEIINELLNIILNIGVIGSCGELCHFLPDKVEQDACDLICDYIGIEEFIKLVTDEDPDPIWICEEGGICPHNDNGSALANGAWVNPQSGPAGSTFDIIFNYTVTSYTSSGGPNVVVVPPAGLPLGGAEFNSGQPIGTYIVAFKLDSTPSEQEPFTPGVYQVEAALCAGDCSGRHKWSSVYCNATTQFSITGK